MFQIKLNTEFSFVLLIEHTERNRIFVNNRLSLLVECMEELQARVEMENIYAIFHKS